MTTQNIIDCWEAGLEPYPRMLRLKTFDKHQGWQTLETFADFESASKRAKAIFESNPLWTVDNLRIFSEFPGA